MEENGNVKIWGYHFSFFICIPHFSLLISHLKKCTMNKKVNAKKEAYAKKQEEKGRNLIMWIIGILIVLGVLYAFWASIMMS